ncbi:MAG: HAMP domain-containing sensor histidine kinase [Coprobacillus sp.]
MKNYNKIITLSIVIYIVIAYISGNIILNMDTKGNQAYRVESQRIMGELKDISSIDKVNLKEYEYIQEIEFLNKTNDKNQIQSFYSDNHNGKMQILPFYQNDELLGYVKFIYELPRLNMNNIFYIVQISLLIFVIFILVVLLYLKKKLIQPFWNLQELPLQLSKGHFKGTLKEEKSQYLGKFMWGMGQLKDSLDISQKRQLELMKEKKKMLLSLSHDIKTPLNLIKLYNKALEENIYEDEDSRKNAMTQIGQKTIEIEKYVDEIIKSSREDILDIRMNNQDFYLQDLLYKVLSVYQEQCQLRQINLIVGEYENKLLKGDIERAQEVFENIFENAFKYGDGRKIEISFYEEDYCQLIHIFNTGQSVNDNEFNHLFESFFRGSNSQGQQGNGLGLYICREIMTKMDGAIFAIKHEDGMSFVLVFR